MKFNPLNILIGMLLVQTASIPCLGKVRLNPTDFIQVENSSGCNVDTIEVVVWIENPMTTIESFGFDLHFNTDMLEYSGSCSRGDLIAEFEFFDCSEVGSGIVRVGGFGTDPLPMGNSGSLAVLDFTVTCAACSQGDTAELFFSDLVDDIQTFEGRSGLFSYICPGTPTFSPTATAYPTDTPTPLPTYTPPPTSTGTVDPTDTPTPLPTDTPTSVPTHTPQPTSTMEPTDTPTPVPTHTPTPPPTDTPTDCAELGCAVWMPSDEFTPGMTCYVTVRICNPEQTTYTGVPVFVILDVYSTYFFAPDFNAFDYYLKDIPPGTLDIQVLPEFQWPAGAGAAEGIRWYAAMTDPGITELFGNLGTFTFGWHE